MATKDRYAVVDTNLSITDATPIQGLNGRQGDNGRIVYFALKDGQLPHNLDGQDVALEVKDAAGKIKIVNGIYDMISATGGLFSMLIPSQVYQAAGDVKEAYLVVKDDKGTAISSVPITFTVFADGIVLSANASQDFIQSVKDAIADADKLIADLNGRITPQEAAIDTLQQTLNEMVAIVNSKQVPTLNSANVFNDNNTFNNDVTVKGALHAKADTAGKADSAKTVDTTAVFNNTSIKHETTVSLLDGTLHLIRYGNTVTAKFNNAGSTILFGQFAGLIPAGSIPAGYRPIDFAALSLEQADWQTGRKAGNVWIYADGSVMSRSTYNKNSTDSSVISIYGTYQTADDMPK